VCLGQERIGSSVSRNWLRLALLMALTSGFGGIAVGAGLWSTGGGVDTPLEQPAPPPVAPTSGGSGCDPSYPDFCITVVPPECVPAHWWEHFLHNQTALRIKAALLFQRGVVTANVPYHLRD
jgi:hypothetical protein